MNTLFGDSIGFSQVAQALAWRMASADLVVAIDLFLGAIRAKGRGQGKALVEPSKDAVDSL